MTRPEQETRHELDAIRAALQLADDQSLLLFVARDAEFDGGLDSCWVEVLACHIPDDAPSMLNWSRWILQFFEGGPRYAVLRWRLWLPESPAFLHVGWNLTPFRRPQIAYHQCATQADWRALKRLEKRMRNQPLSGRPPAPLDLDDVRSVCRRYLERHGRHVTPSELPHVLAGAMNLSESHMKDKLRVLRATTGLKTHQIIHGN